MRKNLIKFLLLTIAFTFALSINYIFAAWTGPTQAPPLGNTPTPVHIGSTAQVKDGGLSLNSLAVFGNGYFQDNVEVAGQIKVGKDDSASPNAGTIRWTGSDLEVYDGTQWKSLTTGDTTIISSNATDCNNVGGNWVDAQGVCYLPAGGGCPSGWTKKENYSTTQSQSCTGNNCNDNWSGFMPGTSCSTGSHYRENFYKTNPGWGQWTWQNQWEWDSTIEHCIYSSSNDNGYGNCSGSNNLCSASQTEVGCVKAE